MSADILLLLQCQIRIQRFLEKTKKKKDSKDKEAKENPATVIKEQKLKKMVTDLMKKQKLRAVRQIVEKHDDLKSWGQDAKAKVCMVFCDCWLKSYLFLVNLLFKGFSSRCTSQVGSRLIELLTQTAYIQPPADQLADGPPDIRPAFLHTFRTVVHNGK